MSLLKGKKKWLSLIPIGALLFSIVGLFNNQQGEAATTSYRYVVMGDGRGSSSGVNEKVLRQLLKQVKNLSPQPSFLLFTGDMVRGHSDLAEELDEWKGIVDDYYPMNMYYPAMGNHEDDEVLFSEKFSHLPSEQLPGYKRTAYYFDYGNSRFITLNSDREDKDGNYIVDAKQRAWLENLLKTSGKTHHFIQVHIPAYPIGGHYGRSLDGNEQERDALWAIFDKYNVDAVMVGHEHNYNRRLIDNSFSQNGFNFSNSINQITLGAAGSPFSSKVEDMKNVEVGPKVIYHYMVVDVIDGVSTFKVYDKDNNLLDSFTVDKSKKSSAPSSSTSSNPDGLDFSSSEAASLNQRPKLTTRFH